MPGQALRWVVFGTIVLVMLALDLGVFHRRAHVVRLREAIVWSAVWIALSLLFNLGVYVYLGPQAGLDFLTAYVIEKSLSIDNIFVFLLIFSYFSVPSQFQHRVLFWGIIAALFMRAFFIAAGLTLIQRFEWIVFVFGAFLIFTGIRMAVRKGGEIHPERNPILKLFRRLFAVSNEYEGARFFVKKDERWIATPLLIVMLVVETSDLVFAVDSIPAVLAITVDPFIIYTSNIFAILGLRALYFALAGIMELFHYLRYGLSAILVFVGVKMLISHIYHVPTVLALGFIAATILISVVASILDPRKKRAEE
jgi:tellurite resistance protein TerC